MTGMERTDVLISWKANRKRVRKPEKIARKKIKTKLTALKLELTLRNNLIRTKRPLTPEITVLRQFLVKLNPLLRSERGNCFLESTYT